MSVRALRVRAACVGIEQMRLRADVASMAWGRPKFVFHGVPQITPSRSMSSQVQSVLRLGPFSSSSPKSWPLADEGLAARVDAVRFHLTVRFAADLNTVQHQVRQAVWAARSCPSSAGPQVLLLVS